MKQLLALLVLVLLAAPVFAEQRFGGDIVVPRGQVIDDDLTVIGGSVTIDGTVNGDLNGAAGSLTINGDVNGDVNFAAGSITINGNVRSLSGGGGAVTINGKVKSLDGGAATLTINGEVGDLDFAGETITINGKITGDAKVKATSVKMGPGAQVLGSFVEIPLEQSPSREELRVQQARSPIILVFDLIGLLIVGWLIMRFAPAVIEEPKKIVREKTWLSFWTGLGLIFLVPISIILAIVLSFFIIGLLLWPLILIALLVLLVILLLSIFFVGKCFGEWLTDKLALGWAKDEFRKLVVGLVAIEILYMVPGISGLTMFVVLLTGLGAGTKALLGHRIVEKPKKKRR